MKLNDEYKATIESFDVNGYGVCHIEGRVIFTEFALEGEEVIIKITNIHKKYCFAKTIKVLKKSPHRTLELNEINNLSGEADLLFVDYETELKIKENKVRNTIKQNDYKFNNIIACDNPYNYRNKTMMPFKKVNEDVIYGYYSQKSHDIVECKNDVLANKKVKDILYVIKRYLVLFNVSIYDEKTNGGIFREVMIRNNYKDEFMIVLVVTKKIDLSRLVEMLTSEFSEIKSIYLNINPKQTNVVLSNEYHLVYGTKAIVENILGLNFEVYPASFLQVNHNQCEKLYSEAFRMANLNENMNVIDAYCGIGSITLNIAKKVNHVYGIEIVEDAIVNANNNKKMNGIENATFICGPCESQIKKLANLTNIDVVFFDPPRKGCDIEFLNTIIEMKIPKIIYISCNVATLARDIKVLKENGYELNEATPVDLFGKTSHVETICLLTRK